MGSVALMVFFANAIHSMFFSDIVLENDLTYLAENCVGLEKEQRDKIGDHVLRDTTFGGAWYIVSQTVEMNSSSDFEAAWRTTWSEAFCAPVVGCAIPVSMRNQCVAG